MVVMDVMTLRLRSPVAVLCIAIAIFAACVPSIVLTIPVAILAPAWLYHAPATAAVVPPADARAEEQTASLLQQHPTRAPPVRASA